MVTAATSTAAEPTTAVTPSPLIFGTNLGLYSESDQFVASQPTRSLLQHIHVQFVRMPIRSVLAPGSPSPNATELQAAAAIKAMGATPLIILHYAQGDALTEGESAIQAMNTIFGDSVVYYEFGNEPDWSAGASPQAYTAKWNDVIGRLKPLALNGRFVGPALAESNPSFIAYFWHNAAPRPDAVSWHEYTCGNSASAQDCIDHIANWSTHIAETKAAIEQNGDPIPPIMITEWNYDPNAPIPDARATPQFQQDFTRAALTQLANDGVFAAAQYVATGRQDFNLVDPGDVLTPEGETFGSMYATLIGTGAPPTLPPATTTPIPSPTASATAQPPAAPKPPATRQRDTTRKCAKGRHVKRATCGCKKGFKLVRGKCQRKRSLPRRPRYGRGHEPTDVRHDGPGLTTLLAIHWKF